jgi:hypothetical protein
MTKNNAKDATELTVTFNPKNVKTTTILTDTLLSIQVNINATIIPKIFLIAII